MSPTSGWRRANIWAGATTPLPNTKGATYPWLAPLVFGNIYNEARTFLSIQEYEHVDRWVKQIAERPAVRRGRIVNKTWGEEDTQMLERHSAADFEGKSL